MHDGNIIGLRVKCDIHGISTASNEQTFDFVDEFV